MLKRIFISIELPEIVKRKIKIIQDKIPLFIGKKTEIENLHLTLKFLGEIDEEKIEIIKKKLSEVEFGKINLEIEELGVFSESFVKIIWIHLGGCEELQKKIDDSLEGIFEKEKRFMSHITIARLKNVRDKKEFLEKLRKIKFGRINLVVDSFYLMESILKSKGPEYNIIKCFKSKEEI